MSKEHKKINRHHEGLNTTPTNLVKVLGDLHPQIENSGIAQTTVDIICSLNPLLLFENDQKGKLLDEDQSYDRIIRGSLIKRLAMGTPDGYADVPEIFKSEKLQNNNDVLTNAITHKLSEGSIEIDLRFRWKDAQKDMVAPTIASSLMQSGFRMEPMNGNEVSFIKNDIEAKIEQHEIGTKDFQRTLFNVVFSKDNKKLFVIDIADIPDQSKFTDEMRLASGSGNFELYSAMELDITKNEVYILMDRSISKLKDEQLTGNYHRTLYSFGHILREVGNSVLWPKVTNGLIDEHAMFMYYKDLGIHYEDIAFASKEKELFEMRKESFMSDIMLYTTINPFLFILLGHNANLFSRLKLGKILEKIDVKWEDVIFPLFSTMSKELGYDGEITHAAIPHLSDLYKKKVLTNPQRDINQIGPILFGNAVKKYLQNNSGHMDSQTNLDYFLSLMTPQQ